MPGPAHTILSYIYKFALAQPKRMRLKMLDIERRSMKHPNYKIVRVAPHGLDNHPGEVYNYDTDTWEPTPPSIASILFTNKQIAHEALPILYGENVFDFDNARTMGLFVKLIGGGALHLGWVELNMDGFLEDGSTNAVFGAFHEMAAVCHNLRCLALYGSDVPAQLRKLGMGKVANLLLFLLRSLQVSFSDKKLMFSPLDVVGIICMPCDVCERERVLEERNQRMMQYGFDSDEESLFEDDPGSETPSEPECTCEENLDDAAEAVEDLKDEVAAILNIPRPPRIVDDSEDSDEDVEDSEADVEESDEDVEYSEEEAE